MDDLLGNVFWHALTGPQARHAVGSGGARRYAPGFSPLLAFADPQSPDFAALRPCCAAGERFYCSDWSGASPDGWRIELEATMFRMVWAGALPPADEGLDAIRLGPQHSAQAVELAELTHPGPFGPRTPELGEYYGVFEGGRLVAMAGERAHAGALREISAVCTHPGHQGRGLARRLMNHLIRRQAARGEVPFLHVMRSNVHAHALYARMGFRHHAEPVVRVVSAPAA
ncbi:MAG TPA: GNAT family N-acetyltransferase [Caldimonas sp.]|jgi:GNAT superfamily N-acetyltransferase|nr:GNAT family N-acetyltransferase [Caldimonas sp.]HEX2539831.1 GNAT family N-acetyltransferase [Caldimonas sp.]